MTLRSTTCSRGAWLATITSALPWEICSSMRCCTYVLPRLPSEQVDLGDIENVWPAAVALVLHLSIPQGSSRRRFDVHCWRRPAGGGWLGHRFPAPRRRPRSSRTRASNGPAPSLEHCSLNSTGPPEFEQCALPSRLARAPAQPAVALLAFGKLTVRGNGHTPGGRSFPEAVVGHVQESST